MNTTRDWEKPARRLERLMRLKSFPVAFKLFEDQKSLSTVPFMRRTNNKSTLCRLINFVRNFDWTVGADLDNFRSVMCASVIGLTDIPDYMKDGTFRSIVWTKTRADGKKFENPISYAAAETDVTHVFPAVYGGEKTIDLLRGTDNRLLLGVTGSIATGKSTVAEMLEELGARTIDFDVLSRVVVEPGKPAWKDIVAFFGEQVLREDRTLDRQKLRDIVFKDMEKKKKLESFQHPRIGEEFVELVKQYAGEDPNAIIQVVVPLLIEVKMQPLFHHILMVYASEEEQKRRLMNRDASSEEMAMAMIRSQLSVDEKKGFCDLIIDNSGSLEETRKQVEKLWEKLKKIQSERRGSNA
jgi:dephospho-CoA kinase